MAAPFVYVPEADPSSSVYNVPHPYYNTPQGGHTPFLPPSPLLYPNSPYLGPADRPATAPNAFNANSILWPDTTPQYESAYAAGWVPLNPRQRTNSWHGPAPQPGSPFLAPTAPAFLHANSASFVPGHRKANSWGNTGAAPPWVAAAAAAQHLPQIHPFLNADAPSPDFFFDLAAAHFLPLRRVNHTQSTPVTVQELAVPAFHPPRTTLRIIHPRLPFWPVDLKLPAGAPGPVPPISLGDVLVALHRSLRARIAHADWLTLDADTQAAATHAFTARCRAEAARSGAPAAALREAEVAARNQGVLRVDFLLGKTVVRGLARAHGDPDGVVRLVTA